MAGQATWKGPSSCCAKVSSSEVLIRRYTQMQLVATLFLPSDAGDNTSDNSCQDERKVENGADRISARPFELVAGTAQALTKKSLVAHRENYLDVCNRHFCSDILPRARHVGDAPRHASPTPSKPLLGNPSGGRCEAVNLVPELTEKRGSAVRRTCAAHL